MFRGCCGYYDFLLKQHTPTTLRTLHQLQRMGDEQVGGSAVCNC